MTDHEQRRIFGENLNHLIALSGKKQQDVADDLDIPHTTFNTWCVGKVIPSVKVLHTLADYFNCSILDLIDKHEAGFEYRFQIVRLFRKHTEINYMKQVLNYLNFLESNPDSWK